VVTAYKEHLRRYVEHVKPSLISYDHCRFRLKGDSKQYFLNLAMIRRAAMEAGVLFLNIVQACTWAPDVMRVPNPDELRYLVYSTLAYGAQGIGYYVDFGRAVRIRLHVFEILEFFAECSSCRPAELDVYLVLIPTDDLYTVNDTDHIIIESDAGDFRLGYRLQFLAFFFK